MESSAHEQMVLVFDEDTTLRWSCRCGDFVLWLQYASPFGSTKLSIPDFWEMRDGDAITITNRIADLPAWFELHPTEVQGSLVYAMMARLNGGWRPPDEPMDGPNLWRLKAGNRLAWIGESRPGQQAANGILAILDFRACALAFGDTNRTDPVDWIGFGSLSTDEMREADVLRCQAALDVVERLGMPRTWSPEWALG